MRKILLSTGLLAAPRVALACPVCFGQNDSPMAVATNMGIFVMPGVVGRRSSQAWPCLSVAVPLLDPIS